VFLDAAERWTQKVGNVAVKSDVVPQGEYIEKLLVRISGGDPPDVMKVNDRMSSDVTMRGTLLKLTDRIKRAGKEGMTVAVEGQRTNSTRKSVVKSFR